MNKDVVLFVDAIRPATFAALDEYEKLLGRPIKPLVLVDKSIEQEISRVNGQLNLPEHVDVAEADFSSAESIREALRPYENRIIAVTAQYENSITELRKLIPYLPYIHLPTETSLEWATEKKLMRKLMYAYDPSLTPAFLEASKSLTDTVEAVEKIMDYPVIVKPSGLEGSLLVSYAANREELEERLRCTFEEIQNGYDDWIKRQKPVVLVEDFMDGQMYSIDTYIARDGTCYHTPIVKVITGRQVGYEDFFGYIRSIPTDLDAQEVKLAQIAAQKACHAVGLRSVTAHVELIKTKDGWKIIELGPRIGGFRQDMYKLGYGINHLLNDILNRAGEKPVIHEEPISNVAVMNIYAREEGIMESIEGLEEVSKLKSLVSIVQIFKPGDEVLFAQNNGDRVFDIVLSHKDQSQLKEDIDFIESKLKISVRRA